MADGTDDLMWDYTGDDSSPLLQRAVSPMYRSDRQCGISRRQVRYLLHSVTEVAQILEAELNNGRLHPVPLHSEPQMVSKIHSCWNQFVKRLLVIKPMYISAGIAILHIIAVIAETVWDSVEKSEYRHSSIVADIVAVVSFILLITLYVVTMAKFIRNGFQLTGVVVSFICSICTFAMFYSVLARLSLPPSRDLFISMYCSMLELSVSIFTMTSNSISVEMLVELNGHWYMQLIVSVQMLLAYGYLVMMVAATLNFVNGSSKKFEDGEIQTLQRPLGRYDPDSDSIGPLDTRVPSEHQAMQQADYRPHTSGSPIVVHHNNVNAPTDDDVLLLSNSV